MACCVPYNLRLFVLVLNGVFSLATMICNTEPAVQNFKLLVDIKVMGDELNTTKTTVLNLNGKLASDSSTTASIDSSMFLSDGSVASHESADETVVLELEKFYADAPKGPSSPIQEVVVEKSQEVDQNDDTTPVSVLPPVIDDVQAVLDSFDLLQGFPTDLDEDFEEAWPTELLFPSDLDGYSMSSEENLDLTSMGVDEIIEFVLLSDLDCSSVSSEEIIDLTSNGVDEIIDLTMDEDYFYDGSLPDPFADEYEMFEKID